MSNINEKENNDGSINTTAVDSNGNGDLVATDTTTVQPSTQTVRFERISNGTCDLTFTPTPTTTTSTTNNTSKVATDTTDTTTTQPNNVSITNVSFPYVFDPSEYGFNSVNGTYTFDCCGCPYVFVIDGEDVTTTTTTKDVTTTTTTKDVTTTTTTEDVTTTTTTEDVTTTTTTEVCDICTTVRVRKANVKALTPVTFNYIDCDNVSQTATLTRLASTVDLCVCSGSIPSSDDYSIEFIEICTTGLPVLTCDLLGFTVNNGESGDLVTFNNGSGLSIPVSVFPTQYVMGVGTYTLTVTVPSGYSNEGATLECVNNEVIVTSSGGNTTTTSTGSSEAFCAKITYGPNSPDKLQTSLGGEIHEFLISQQLVFLDSDGGGYFNKCTDTGTFLVVEGNSPRVISEIDDIDVTYNTEDRCVGEQDCTR